MSLLTSQIHKMDNENFQASELALISEANLAADDDDDNNMFDFQGETN